MKGLRWLWLLGLGLVLSVGFFNQGIIALDDYSEGFARFIPAQNILFKNNLETAGIRLPFQSVFLLALSKLGLFLGITHPLNQVRFVLMVLGVLVYSIQTSCAVMFFTEPRKRFLALLFCSFYFLLPLVYTRPLIENMSGAFVTLSAFCAFYFDKTKQTRWISASVLSIACASLFRFQTGVCFVAIGFLVFLSQNKKTWAVFFGASVLSFLFTGLLDLFLTGGFHRSLLSYVTYNLQHSSSYGTTPFYTFALVFLGLSIPPSFLGRYPRFSWKKSYEPLLTVFLFWFVFLVAHSIIPHKEERFIIPILPLFLILLVPLAHYWFFERKSRWRIAYFCSVNFLLLPLTSFSTPQRNVIELVKYVDKNPKIKEVINYSDAVVLFPIAFALRDFKVTPQKALLATAAVLYNCGTAVAVTEPDYHLSFRDYPVLATFSPGPLEGLLVKLNPRQNARRGTLYLLEGKLCD